MIWSAPGTAGGVHLFLGPPGLCWTTTFYYILFQSAALVADSIAGIPGYFSDISKKQGSTGKVGCFPLFSFPQKVGKNKHHVPLCGGPMSLGFSEVFQLKGQGGGNNAGAGDVSKC